MARSKTQGTLLNFSSDKAYSVQDHKLALSRESHQEVGHIPTWISKSKVLPWDHLCSHGITCTKASASLLRGFFPWASPCLLKEELVGAWDWGVSVAEALSLGALQLLNCMLTIQWSAEGSGKGAGVLFMKSDPPCPPKCCKSSFLGFLVPPCLLCVFLMPAVPPTYLSQLLISLLQYLFPFWLLPSYHATSKSKEE